MFDFEDSDSDSSIITELPVNLASRRHAGLAPQMDAAINLTPVRSSKTRSVMAARSRNAAYFAVKHFCERVFAAALLVLSAPVIMLLIAVVRLTSKGPGVYRQERVGLNRKTFNVLKLRTMYQDAEADGQAKWSQKGDPRVTPVGRFLRRSHLDELPQLWNVVAGDMSLTGPRPERPAICEKLERYIGGYYNRNSVKPGITGLAQINLEPDCTLDDVRRKQLLDMHYVRNAGPWLDCRMILATMMRVVGIRGPAVTRAMGLCRMDLIDAAGLSAKDGQNSQSIQSLSDRPTHTAVEEFESLVAVRANHRLQKTDDKRSGRLGGRSRPR
ncbi:sugar transferase [Stieleria tagensis]|uniref:sugar transferase n=1 Tax=Stieleria tagensis TaxID=2956795 RepID=UPI00209B6E38|nr:sugar transferase [Stieleria tagensis]